MNCPHCGFENPEGRKYCRGCAKALAAPPAAAPVEAEPVDQLAAPVSIESSSVDSTSLTLPSIAHASREESHAAESVYAPATSGISRNLIAIAAVLVVVIAAAAFWFLHKSSHDQDAQAAAAQNAANSVAYHPDAASLKNREHALAAMRLIVAQQEARLADDPDDLDVCAVNTFGNDELGQHARESHYIIDQQCQPRTADGRAIRNGFTVTATPKIEDNPSGAPTYCVDQTKIVRRYADSNEVNNATSIQHLTCPLDGQPVQ
jgi:hypothetical protein